MSIVVAHQQEILQESDHFQNEPDKRDVPPDRTGMAGVHGVGALAETVEQATWDGSGTDPEWLAIFEEEATPISKLWPDEWALYRSYFIDFWPRSVFWAFRDYWRGWLQLKKKATGQPLYCFDDFIEQHLDSWRWATHLQVHEKKSLDERAFCIIGLNAPKRTKVACFDIDNKGKGPKRESIVGWYPSPDLQVRREPALLPVMMPQIEQFRTAKIIHEAGLAETWCISSETLGLHAWKKLPGLMSTTLMRMHYLAHLRRLGLTEGKGGDLELHPTYARCLRRPFGIHYRTVTDTGLLTGWIDQVRYFDRPNRPPTFEAIFQALERLYLEQWQSWHAHGDARKGKRPLDISVLQTHFASIKDGLLAPVQRASISVPISHPERPQPQRHSIPGRKKIDIKGICQTHAYIATLLGWAKGGIPSQGALFDVVSQLAAWLLWVEFFPAEADDVVATLVKFIERKHNNHCSRWPDQRDEVEKQIKRIVNLKRLEGDNDIWASIRAKRASGAYRRLIFLGPILRGESTLEMPAPQHTHSSPSVLLECDTVRFERLLTEVAQLAQTAKMRKRAGEYPVVRFVKALVRELYGHGGTKRLSQRWFQDVGFKNPSDRERFKDLLFKANILLIGEYYPRRRSRRYSLTQEAMEFLQGSRDDLGEAPANTPWPQVREILGV